MAKKEAIIPEPTHMLYKYPGSRKIHGDMFDYVVVKESELEDKIQEGWSKTTAEAKQTEAVAVVVEEVVIVTETVEEKPKKRRRTRKSNSEER